MTSVSVNPRQVSVSISGARGAQGLTGRPGGNVMSVGKFTSLSGMDVDDGTTVVRTSGYDDQDIAGNGIADYIEFDEGSVSANQAYVAANPLTAFEADGSRFFRLTAPTGVAPLAAFGALYAGAPATGTFDTLPPDLPSNDADRATYDATPALRAAILWCIANGVRLDLGEGCLYFENEEPLVQAFGLLNMTGRGYTRTQLFVNFTKAADPKTADFLVVSNGYGGRWADFSIRTNAFLGRGIRFTLEEGDNQTFTLERVMIDTCRWGLFCDEGECLNRVVIRNCQFVTNWFAGAHLISYTSPDPYAQSAPIQIIDTIFNGNGPLEFAMAGSQVTYGPGPNITVRDGANDIGVQLHVRGFANLNIVRGQISAHGEPRNRALAVFENGYSAQITGCDIEDMTNGWNAAGTVAFTDANLDAIETTYASDISGAAIVCNAVAGFSIDECSLYQIECLATIKLLNDCTRASIGGITPDIAYRYNVWDTCTALTGAQNFIHPTLVCSVDGINATAFRNLGSPPPTILLHHEVSPVAEPCPQDVRMWGSGSMANPADLDAGFTLAYLASATTAPTPATHLFNEIELVNLGAPAGQPEELTHVFVTAPYAAFGTGRVFVQAVDSGTTVLGGAFFSPDVDFANGAPAMGVARFKVPAGTRKIRYGVVNSAAFTGTLEDHYMAGYSSNEHFFLRVEGVSSNYLRYGPHQPPYTAARDLFRVGLNRIAVPSDTAAATVGDLVTAFNGLLAELRKQ